MSDLIDTMIEALGGLERWNQLDRVSARAHRPFGAADRHSAFTPERVAIENDDGTVVEAVDQPRASFADDTLETPWSTLQLAYFVGTAMWTYLTQPFTFTLPTKQ